MVVPNLSCPKELALLLLCKDIDSAARYTCSNYHDNNQLEQCKYSINVDQRPSVFNKKLGLISEEFCLGAPCIVVKVEEVHMNLLRLNEIKVDTLYKHSKEERGNCCVVELYEHAVDDYCMITHSRKHLIHRKR